MQSDRGFVIKIRNVTVTFHSPSFFTLLMTPLRISLERKKNTHTITEIISISTFLMNYIDNNINLYYEFRGKFFYDQDKKILPNLLHNSG